MIEANKLDDLDDILKRIQDDDFYWNPFCKDEEAVKEFEKKIALVEESRSWPKERNDEKGTALEELMKFIFNRFINIGSIERDKLTTDNEIDVYIDFNKNLINIFLSNIKGKILCECKNIANSIDVGMVSKLSELCEKNQSGLGIFISNKGLSKGRSGSMWKNAEGKRRKLYLSNKIPIISFTLDEIKQLKYEGINFFTIIKNKVNYLIDEIDDCTISLPGLDEESEYIQYLHGNLNHLNHMGFLTDEESEAIKLRIKQKYNVDCKL